MTEACRGLEAVDGWAVLDDTCHNLFDGIRLRREVLGFLGMAVGVETQADLAERYGDYFTAHIK